LKLTTNLPAAGAAQSHRRTDRRLIDDGIPVCMHLVF
jgi:hypothetical protein